VVFGTYLGWITAATIANAATVLYNAGWNGLGVSPEAWAVTMLIAGAVISSAVALTRRDIAYVLVIMWAFAGIAVKHANEQAIMPTAWVMACVVVIMLVVGLYVHHRRKTS
jgi:hypothetical protein